MVWYFDVAGLQQAILSEYFYVVRNYMWGKCDRLRIPLGYAYIQVFVKLWHTFSGTKNIVHVYYDCKILFTSNQR